jgi:DNA-binding PadR family transcriptional regulator
VDGNLGETGWLILTALVAEAQHGYAMIEDIHRITDGEIRLHTGTLYAVLDRLRKAGLIEVDREEVVQSRLRRYYRLTTTGAQRLADESVKMQRRAKIAHQRLRRAGIALGPGAA